MANSAQIGFGTVLSHSADGVSYTDLSEVLQETTGPGVEVDSVECTNMDSPDGFREYKPGLGGGGEVSVTCLYTEALLNTLYGFARTTKYWRITYPGSSKWEFQGFFTSLEPSDPLDDVQ